MKGCEEENGGWKVLNESRGKIASLPYLIDYIGPKPLNCTSALREQRECSFSFPFYFNVEPCTRTDCFLVRHKIFLSFLPTPLIQEQSDKSTSRKPEVPNLVAQH